MNPLTNIKNLNKLNQRELALGLTNKKSWHDQYRDSAWIFVGGLPYDLSEGDVVCVFSQYGEVVNINLVRDQKTGKSKGYCFICYEDQRSTVLTVDNMNGSKVLERTLRVDHVADYKKPKETGEEDEITQKIRAEGIAPRVAEVTHRAPEVTHRAPSPQLEKSEDEQPFRVGIKKGKKAKQKKEKKKKKKKQKQSSSESESNSDSDVPTKHIKTSVNVKKEKHDPGYNRALGISTGDSADRHVDRGDKNERTSRKGDKQNHSPDNENRREYKYSKSDSEFNQSGRDKARKEERVKQRIRDRDEYRTDRRMDEYDNHDKRDRYETSDQRKYSTQGRDRQDSRNDYDDRDRRETERVRDRDRSDRDRSDRDRSYNDRDRSHDRSKDDRHKHRDRR